MLGGKGSDNKPIVGGTVIDGVEYPKNTVTVSQTTIRNDVEDGVS